MLCSACRLSSEFQQRMAAGNSQILFGDVKEGYAISSVPSRPPRPRYPDLHNKHSAIHERNCCSFSIDRQKILPPCPKFSSLTEAGL